MAVWTSLAAPSGVDTSSPLTTAWPPLATISSTTCWAAETDAPLPSTSPPRSLTTTWAPWRASSRACPRPIPRPAPVTTATRPSQICATAALLCWFEHRDGAAVLDGVPGQADPLPYRHAQRFGVDDVGHEPDTLVQLNQGHRVGNLVLEFREGGVVLDADRVHRAPARGLPPLDIAAQAARTGGARIPERTLAPRAPGKDELSRAGGLPIGTGLDRLQLGGSGHNVASVPRMTVDVAESTPPTPWAMATSTSGTWRGPAAPWIWRVASTRRNIPNIPGWV